MTLDVTEHFELPLPHPDNNPRLTDVPRLRTAIEAIDAYLHELVTSKADKAQVASDIAAAVEAAVLDLLAGAPEAYDTLKEIADKLSDNDNVVSAILSTLGQKANSANVYSKTQIDAALAATSRNALRRAVFLGGR